MEWRKPEALVAPAADDELPVLETCKEVLLEFLLVVLTGTKGSDGGEGASNTWFGKLLLTKAAMAPEVVEARWPDNRLPRRGED